MILKYLSLAWEDIAPALKNHLWQSTIFACVVVLLALILRRNHARTRYWLWLAVSAKFLIPFSLLAVLGSHLAIPHHAASTQANLYSAMDEFTQPFIPQAATSASPLPAPKATPPKLLRVFPAMLAGVWFGGFAIILSLWFVYWRRIAAIIRNAMPIAEGRELEVLRHIERACGLRAPINLLLSPAPMEPGIFGILRPELIWPEGISQRFDDAHLKAILAHEVCHVRHRDNLTASVHMLVEAVFWFYPPVWWIGARLMEERERACDEEVVLICNQPEVYAESILKVCEFCLESPLACVSGITGSDLKKRILIILAKRTALKLDLSRKLLLGAAGLVAVSVPVVLSLAQATGKMPDWQKAAGGKMMFKTASVKPNQPGVTVPNTFLFGIDDTPIPPGGHFSANIPLVGYIEFAYKVMLTQQQVDAMVAHLPKWVWTDRYVIEAEAAGNPTKDQMRLMIQSLLADRFKLAVHFETREMPVFDLVLDQPGKIGPGLSPHEERIPCDINTRRAPPDNSSSPVPPGAFVPNCGWVVTMREPDFSLFMGARDIPMQHIAPYISMWLHAGRPVVDRTGLRGMYDLSLDWAPDRNDAPDPGANIQREPGAPTFSEALKEQLGLKLVPANGQVETLVIDHVEKPSPN